MTEDQIKHMVSRFLGWRLPNPWHPDGGVSYKRPNYAHPPADHDWPVGTNLFDAQQAEAMVRYMAEGMSLDCAPETPVVDRLTKIEIYPLPNGTWRYHLHWAGSDGVNQGNPRSLGDAFHEIAFEHTRNNIAPSPTLAVSDLKSEITT